MTVVSEEHLALLACIHLVHGNKPRAPRVNALERIVLLNTNPVKGWNGRWSDARTSQEARCDGIYSTYKKHIHLFSTGFDVTLTFT